MKISIITVCKNAEKTIEAPIRSITQQIYKNIEYIIVDGKSWDNTLKIIKRNRINRSNLISECDAGGYDAMIKGIQLATGEYLIFINADDMLLHPTIIVCFVDNILKYSLGASDILYGKIIIYNSKDGHGSIWGYRHISNYQLYCSSVPHPATFFHKNALEKTVFTQQNFKLLGTRNGT